MKQYSASKNTSIILTSEVHFTKPTSAVPWLIVLQDLIQAEDRAHRIGQADSVLVQYLIQEKSVDDIIWPLIQDKLNLLNKAGLGQDKFEVEQVEQVQVKSMEDINSIANWIVWFFSNNYSILFRAKSKRKQSQKLLITFSLTMMLHWQN